MKTESKLILGDCLKELPKLEENSIDTCITDPPYELGFMGKTWDSSGVAFDPKTWRAVYRVLKPGAFLLCFGGTRTFHRITCAIEDAGFAIRDCMMWLYGSGFPKSLNISKAIDKAAGAERNGVGLKSYANDVLTRASAGSGEKLVVSGDGGLDAVPATDAAKLWEGWGTAIKPAWEPIIVAMKPCDGTFAENALTHGVAGLNIDGSRIEAPAGDCDHPGDATIGPMASSSFNGSFDGSRKPVQTPPHVGGRFPANLILDEKAGALLDEQSGHSESRRNETPSDCGGNTWSGTIQSNRGPRGHTDSGGASRFFYCAKASKSERGEGNDHPTVKPLKLMEYLCTLTKTPTGGIVLDPFLGSGTTALACRNTGRPCVGIEMSPAYMKIAKARLKSRRVKPDSLTLFGA